MKATAIMAAIVPDNITFFLELMMRIEWILNYSIDKRAILNNQLNAFRAPF